MLTSPNAKATVPKSSPPQTLLLPFGKNLYLVPATAIKSYAKSANEQIKTGEDLGALLATKAPEKWKPYCKPDYLACIEGETGKCVYTTFDVPGWPEERRFLRLISATVAAKNFEQIKEEASKVPITNERQQTRMEVLDWNKEERLPQPRADQPRDREVGDRHGRGAGQVVLQGAREPRSAPSRGQPRRRRPRPSASSTSATRSLSSSRPAPRTRSTRWAGCCTCSSTARRPRWLTSAVAAVVWARRRRRRRSRSARARVCVCACACLKLQRFVCKLGPLAPPRGFVKGLRHRPKGRHSCPRT